MASMYGCFDSVRARLAHGACVVSVARSGKGGKGPQRFSLVDFGSKAQCVACGGTVVGLQAYRAAYEGYFWECVRLVLHSGAQNSLRTYVHTFHAPGSPPHVIKVRPASGCSPELCLRRTPAQPTSSPIAGGRAGSVSRSPPSSRPRGVSAWRARQVLSLEC